MEQELELRGCIKELKGTIQEYQSELQVAEDTLAHLLCPFKIGNVIIDKSMPRPVAYELAFISRGYGTYKMKGRKIKKDGTPGKVLTVLYHWKDSEWVCIKEKC